MNIGVIGYGFRISGMVQILMNLEMGVNLVSVCDVNHEAVKETLRQQNFAVDSIRFYTEADDMLNQEQLDGVIIGTRCSEHASLAVKVLKRGLPLFLEKPVATKMEDLLMLKAEYEKSTSEVIVSFPLRLSPIVETVKEIVDSDKIGRIEHVQAWNNVPYGGVYFHHWYRNEQETGGLFLQKATHDFDYLNAILGMEPVMIAAMTSKQIFKGDKAAGLRCEDCDENETCTESPFQMKHFQAESPYGEWCSFAEDTGNEDSGSAIIRYKSGMHVSYSQNFFVRKGAGSRGARLMGYKGTIEFDWFTDEIKVFMHHTPRVESYRLDTTQLSHGGGDARLMTNFVRVMQKKEKSISPLDAGLLSALMCLKAKESAKQDVFLPIDWE